jgi:hypothetical protein
MKFQEFNEDSDFEQGLCVCHPKLKSASEVPAYLVDNPYITEGFRLLDNHWDAFKSLFYYHNCLLDTWTSVLTGIQAVILFVFSAVWPTAQWQHGPSDRACLTLFMVMGVLHSPSSVVYHLFGHAGISEQWYYFYQRLDFFMIFFSMNFLAVSLAWYPWGHAPEAVGAAGFLSFTFSMVVLYNIRKDVTPLGRIRLIAVHVSTPLESACVTLKHAVIFLLVCGCSTPGFHHDGARLLPNVHGCDFWAVWGRHAVVGYGHHVLVRVWCRNLWRKDARALDSQL